MCIFLRDRESEYYYDDLLSMINSSKSYCPAFQNKELFKFFSNLVLALVGNQPVTLLDSDFTNQELEALGIDNINVPRIIEKPNFPDFNSLIKKVRESESIISIFTSGTTGQPKKVSHSYANLSRAVRRGERFFNNVWGFAYNPTHMAGLQVFFQALENQNTIINLFNLNKIEIYDKIDEFKITNISATPTFYRLLLPCDKKYDSVCRVTLGGEKSDEKLYQSIIKIFPNAKITNVYASTEAGTLFAAKGDNFQIPINIKDKFKVVDDELYIHSSLIGKSQTLKLDGDYYPSGDLIEWVDFKKGVFRFKSRKNELINIGGYKVNPQEIEESIRSIDGIRDVHVFGKANSILGNILCADVLREKECSITETEIRAILKDGVQDFKIPRRIRFVESLTVTRTGKMKR